MEESRTSTFGAVSGSASRDRVTSESDSVIEQMQQNLNIAGENGPGSPGTR
jgi:hypothetical protein